ncbi:hypothetical protein ABZ079_26490 [Streptomyces sp. NPDC006314]|uniref:hypothetical protein n=1 Tax=Streptomyces sp. NPDC006314 TaxID=3154475 RepID=UPI0033AE4B74
MRFLTPRGHRGLRPGGPRSSPQCAGPPLSAPKPPCEHSWTRSTSTSRRRRDDLTGRVRALKAEEGGLGVYLCGGSCVAGEPLDEIDELVRKSHPIVHGTGRTMFGAGPDIKECTLDGVRALTNGVVVRNNARRH